MNAIDTSETALRLERLIPVSPEILFALWIEPAQLVKWWAPDGYRTSVHALETKPGGRWRIILHAPDGTTPSMSGVYRVVEPPRRLAFSWAWDGEGDARGHESEVSVDFEPAPGGTRLVLVHRQFEGRQARDRHNNGWTAALNHLTTTATGAAGDGACLCSK
jgi:uncharacterized protein YndB with AHSA1/START domain